jgi:hypothetical protein
VKSRNNFDALVVRSKRIDTRSHASTGSDDGDLKLHMRLPFLRDRLRVMNATHDSLDSHKDELRNPSDTNSTTYDDFSVKPLSTCGRCVYNSMRLQLSYAGCILTPTPRA